jgi:hypothetical protein
VSNCYKGYYSHEMQSYGNIANASSKRRSTALYDAIIKPKATTTRIIDISNETVRLESNDKASYWKILFRVHWDSV